MKFIPLAFVLVGRYCVQATDAFHPSACEGAYLEIVGSFAPRPIARSPFKDTFTIELANGSNGYLPKPRHHDLGGCETWFGTNRVEREASEKITARALEMLQQVRTSP